MMYSVLMVDCEIYLIISLCHDPAQNTKTTLKTKTNVLSSDISLAKGTLCNVIDPLSIIRTYLPLDNVYHIKPWLFILHCN